MSYRFPAAVCFVLMILVGLIGSACSKEDLIPVSGLITDPNQAIPVEGAKVEIWTQQIEGGIFTANYVLAGSAITGIDGTFLFNLENKNYTGIRLKLGKEGYYGWEPEINLDKIKTDHSFYAVYQLLPGAVLKIRVKNSEPFGSDDYFEFRILNGYSGCEECCKGEKYQFTGMDVDQTIDCKTSGHQDILIQWSKRKNGEQIFKTDSYFVKAFQETGIELNY